MPNKKIPPETELPLRQYLLDELKPKLALRYSTNTSILVTLAVAVRSARTALGWNQLEFADKLGVAKSTIARIETAESFARADVLIRAMQVFREAGVTIDLLGTDKGIQMQIGEQALEEAARRLGDELMRRSDRKKGKE